MIDEYIDNLFIESMAQFHDYCRFIDVMYVYRETGQLMYGL